MSRYVAVALDLGTLEEVHAALIALELPAQREAGGQVMLEGSLECAGEPVDIRLDEGVAGAVEDFGFVVSGDGISLVCGDVDRRLLERTLVPRLRAAVAEQRARAHADARGMDVETSTEVDGTRRIRLKRRG